MWYFTYRRAEWPEVKDSETRSYMTLRAMCEDMKSYLEDGYVIARAFREV